VAGLKQLLTFKPYDHEKKAAIQINKNREKKSLISKAKYGLY
jgi:hypothetical protein